MFLTDLVRNAQLADTLSFDDDKGSLEIKGLECDSRNIKDGYLFAGLPGAKADGRRFIDAAVKAGAVAVLVPEGTDVEQDVVVLKSKNVRRDLALLAAAFYPKQPQRIVAVTGTNGKTSIVNFVRQIWMMQGHKAASLGTIGLQTQNSLVPGSLTTPDSVSLHRDIAQAAHDGITHLAIEASSHGIHQHRLDGLQLIAGGFTNLTHEHLDYHKTFEDYRAAKGLLFSELLPELALVALNSDSDQFDFYASLCKTRKHHVFTYGHGDADIKILKREPKANGQDVELSIMGEKVAFSLPLVGEFQLMNLLCAGILCLEDRENAQQELISMAPLFEKIKNVAGRLERVEGHPQHASIYVDYAHTPDALETVLEALRPHVESKLICVVGCGGDRDRKKRPMMGEIATRLSDVVVITDDNPRTEDPAFIRSEMLAAAPGAHEIFPRDKAITESVGMLDRGDILLIAGKGHEQGQIIGETTHPFDDVSQARDAIANL